MCCACQHVYQACMRHMLYRLFGQPKPNAHRSWCMCVQVNRFALETGFSVALYGIGGTFTDQADAEGGGVDPCIATVRNKGGGLAGPADFKVAVLTHGTGSVATALVERAEISKFVSGRGVKDMAALQAAQQDANHA